jgi:hypothetical protein
MPTPRRSRPGSGQHNPLFFHDIDPDYPADIRSTAFRAFITAFSQGSMGSSARSGERITIGQKRLCGTLDYADPM